MPPICTIYCFIIQFLDLSLAFINKINSTQKYCFYIFNNIIYPENTDKNSFVHLTDTHCYLSSQVNSENQYSSVYPFATP